MNARVSNAVGLLVGALLVAATGAVGAQSRATAAEELARVKSDFGQEAERRFVRAFRHLDGADYREMSEQFLQRRERELRRFLTRYPLAEEAHEGRIMLARTLLYRDAFEEAQSLLKMVQLTTSNPALERDAKFALARVYRKRDPLQARALLLETAGDKKAHADTRARAYFELAAMSDGEIRLGYLRRGASSEDGIYRRRCWQRLLRTSPKDGGTFDLNTVAPAFKTTTTDGKTSLDSTRLAGDVYLVCYWSERSADLARIRSLLGAMRQNHGDQGIHLIGVGLDGDAKRLNARIAGKRDPWIEVGNAWGRLHELAIRHGVDRGPFFVLVDATGHYRYHGGCEIPESATKYAETHLWKMVERVVRERAKALEAQ